MTVHTSFHKPIAADATAQIFTEARTHNGFIDKPVPEELLRRAVELAELAPTSANQSPMRIVFVRSKEAKQRLAPTLSPGNLREDARRAGGRDRRLRPQVLRASAVPLSARRRQESGSPATPNSPPAARP